MEINARGVILRYSAKPNNWSALTKGCDVVDGTAKHDVFHMVGNDAVSGGGGDDSYHLWDAGSTVKELPGGGVDTLYVRYWGKASLPNHVENLVLDSPGATTGWGNGLNNIIAAGSVGALLNGAGGDDVLIGGAGADVFQFIKGHGSDAVKGFQAGVDQVELKEYGVYAFSALKALGVQAGADARFDFGNGEFLLLRNTNLAALTAADFKFANTAPEPTKPVVTSPTYMLTTMAGPSRHHTANGWDIITNAFKSAGLTYGTDYTIVVSYNTADLTAGTRMDWSYPTTTSSPVRAYPALGFGPSPLAGGVAAPADGGVFPIRVDAITGFRAIYDLSWSGNAAGFDVAYDIWFTSQPYGGRSTITNEVMIWLHQGDVPTFGTRIATYSQGDFAGAIYHNAASNYTALVANADSRAGELDLDAFFDRLVALGILETNEYLAVVQLGAEVVSGAGSLTFNNFDMVVETTNASGATVRHNVMGTGVTTITTPATAALGGQPDPEPFDHVFSGLNAGHVGATVLL